MTGLRKLSFDAVVIGGGGAGMRASLQMAPVRLQNRMPNKSVSDALTYGFCSRRHYLRDCECGPKR